MNFYQWVSLAIVIYRNICVAMAILDFYKLFAKYFFDRNS